MSPPKHTPAPWTAEETEASWDIWAAHRSRLNGPRVLIAQTEEDDDDPDLLANEREANARLIAAAPDLLDSAKASLLVHDSIAPCAAAVCPCRAVRASIAKAEAANG